MEEKGTERNESGYPTFQGSFGHTIDAKGRTIIPGSFRTILAEYYDSRLVLTRNDQCIAVYPEREWETKVMEKVNALPMFDDRAKSVRRYLLSRALAAGVDRQGRIIIPADLRSFARLEKEIYFVGGGSCFEIWNRDRWVEEDAKNAASFLKNSGDLGI